MQRLLDSAYGKLCEDVNSTLCAVEVGRLEVMRDLATAKAKEKLSAKNKEAFASAVESVQFYCFACNEVGSYEAGSMVMCEFCKSEQLLQCCEGEPWAQHVREEEKFRSWKAETAGCDSDGVVGDRETAFAPGPCSSDFYAAPTVLEVPSRACRPEMSSSAHVSVANTEEPRELRGYAVNPHTVEVRKAACDLSKSKLQELINLRLAARK